MCLDKNRRNFQKMLKNSNRERATTVEMSWEPEGQNIRKSLSENVKLDECPGQQSFTFYFFWWKHTFVYDVFVIGWELRSAINVGCYWIQTTSSSLVKTLTTFRRSGIVMDCNPIIIDDKFLDLDQKPDDDGKRE